MENHREIKSAPRKRKHKARNGYLYYGNGRPVSRKDYWHTKFELSIQKNIDLLLNFRINPAQMQKIADLMDQWSCNTPSELLHKLINSVWKMSVLNKKDERIKIILQVYGIDHYETLFERLVDAVYSQLMVEFYAIQQEQIKTDDNSKVR